MSIHRLLIVLSVCFTFTANANEDTRPNILVIMADDLGFADIG